MKLHEARVSLAEAIAASGSAEYSDVQLAELTEALEDFLPHLVLHVLLGGDLVSAIANWGETGGKVA